MSFGDDIRTIARTKELTEKIDKAVKAAIAAQKAAIEGKRAIAYLQANGSLGTQTGGKPGETKLDDDDPDEEEEIDDDKDDEIDDPEEDSTKPKDPNGTDPSGNGSPGGSRDPLGNPRPGTYGFQELIDGAESGAINRLAQSEGDGKGGGVPGSKQVKTITGIDPSTGLPFYINTDGFYDSVDGWSDPNIPPPYDGWQQGYYWRATNPALGEGSVPSLAADASIAAIRSGSPPWPTGYGDAFISTQPTQSSISEWIYGWKQGRSSDPENVVSINRVACTSEGAILCPSTEPTKETVWSLAGNFALSLIGGLYTPSPYDSEVPPIKKNVTSSVVSEIGEGRWAVLRPARGGGQIMYEVDAPYADANPVEGGTGLWFRNDWTLGNFVPNNNVHRWIVPDS